MIQKLHIGCDHAGFDLKQELINLLSSQSYELTDHGCFSKESMDYPDVVHPLADAVEADSESLGLLICGSGNGVCLTANKHKAIRAALCWLPELGALARQHNNANILCLPARFISSEQAKEIVSAYLNAEFEGGRHQTRVDKIVIG
jgi:ribose 5-phosphate isomerase B